MNYFSYFPQLLNNYQYFPKLNPIYDQQYLRNQFYPQFFPGMAMPSTYYDLQANYFQQLFDQKQVMNGINPQILHQLKALQEQKLFNAQESPQIQAQKQQFKSTENTAVEQKSRSRRLAHQIERMFSCPVADCKKSYGSEGSLGQHIKLKHPNYYAQFNSINNFNKNKNTEIPQQIQNNEKNYKNNSDIQKTHETENKEIVKKGMSITKQEAENEEKEEEQKQNI